MERLPNTLSTIIILIYTAVRDVRTTQPDLGGWQELSTKINILDEQK